MEREDSITNVPFCFLSFLFSKAVLFSLMPMKFGVSPCFAPEFIEAQRASFLRLLSTGIPTELEKHSPITFTVTLKNLPERQPRRLPFSYLDENQNSSISTSKRAPSQFRKLQEFKGPEETNPGSFFSPRIRVNPVTSSDFKMLSVWFFPKHQLITAKNPDKSRLKDLKLMTLKPFPAHSENWRGRSDPGGAVVGEGGNLRLTSLKEKTKSEYSSFFSSQRQATFGVESAVSSHSFHADLRSLDSSVYQAVPGFKKRTRPMGFRKKLLFGVHFHASHFRLIPPKRTQKTSLLQGQTYSARMYVPADLRDPQGKILFSEWVSLGRLPLMTNRGHFIINGTPRVVLHQLVRSPGVYYYKAKNKNTYYADVICHRGVWLRFETDKKGLIWVRLKNHQKLPVLGFLQAFGLDHPHFLSQLESKALLQDPMKETEKVARMTTMAREVFRGTKQARLAFDLLFIDSKGVFKLNQRARFGIQRMNISLKFLQYRFSKEAYDLSEVGRRQLNRKFGLHKSRQTQTLTLDDLVCIINHLLHVESGALDVDDIDHLKNRRVRCSGELIQNQVGAGLQGIQQCEDHLKWERSLTEFREKTNSGFGKKKRIERLMNTKPLLKMLRDFFNSSPLSQFMDQTNPLAELTHKRRLSSLGPGGITKETAGMKIRSIHPSHYGRICPIETPEGPNAGLVNSLTTYARIHPTGFLQTPFYRVVDGQVQNTDPNRVLYFLADQDEVQAIAPPDLQTNTLSMLKGKTIPIRLGSEFLRTTRSDVDFMSISRIQMISVATSLIPFLEHNDANRALMGSNMQRQSVPLLRPERAIVGTGLEGRVVTDSGHSVQARESGLVTYASSIKIQVFSFFEKKAGQPLIHGEHQTSNPNPSQGTPMLYKGQPLKGKAPLRASTAYKDRNKQILSAHLSLSGRPAPSLGALQGAGEARFEAGVCTYYLQNFTRSNQNTCLVQRPLVQEGDWVERGSCLADCSSSAFGELAIGKNILVGYLPWEGYNFEDAILVSERLIYDDLFTSVHIVRSKTEIRETKFGLEEITSRQFEDGPTAPFDKLDANGIIQLGTWVAEGDILVRKVCPVGKQQLNPYQKFLYTIVEKPMPTVKDTSLRVSKGLEGRVIDIKIRKASAGFSTEPIGPECVIVSIAEKKWLQVGDKMAGRHGNKGIVSRILPRQDMPYLPDGTPLDMVLNPLGVPSRMNVGQLYECLLGLAGRHLNQNYKVIPFDEISGPQASRSLVFSKLYEAKKKTGRNWLLNPKTPGKMPLFDGRTGRAFDQAITVGQPYMLKLIHLVDEKIHARATGPYSLVTQQPLRGRSKKGGQRFGEMEVWALEGFGAAYTLQEILTIKSDDIYGRKQVIDTLTKDKPFKISKPESFRVLIRELQALCLNVNIFESPLITKLESGKEYRRGPTDLDTPDFNQY